MKKKKKNLHLKLFYIDFFKLAKSTVIIQVYEILK